MPKISFKFAIALFLAFGASASNVFAATFPTGRFTCSSKLADGAVLIQKAEVSAVKIGDALLPLVKIDSNLGGRALGLGSLSYGGDYLSIDLGIPNGSIQFFGSKLIGINISRCD